MQSIQSNDRNFMTNQDGPLLEIIPSSQLQPHQLVQYRDGEVWPACKFRRTPQSVEEFDECTSKFSIWQENGTRILMGPLRVSDDHVLSFDDMNANNTMPTRYVDLADDDRCFFVFFNDWSCTIVGKSDHAVAETATFLWGLSEWSWCLEVRCSRRRFDFSVVSLEQLAFLFRTRPLVRIKLDVANISPAQSRFLAEFPDSKDLILDLSSNAFSDGGDTFVNSLRASGPSFGTLTMFNKSYPDSEIFRRLLQAGTLDKLVMPSVRPSQIRQLFSALVKEVDFTINVEEALGLPLQWSTVDIIPKKLTLTFKVRYDSGAHTEFVCSFFRRVAELGTFTKFDFDLGYTGCQDLPARAANALIHAVTANRGLEELALHQSHYEIGPYLKDIFVMAACHDGLACLRIDTYPVETDPHYLLLKRLLKRNLRIQVIDHDKDRVTNGDEIDRLYESNLFCRNSRGLAEEPLSLLPSLVGEALIRSGNNDFRRFAFLMTNHTDAVCELVQYSSFSSAEAHSSNAVEGSAGTEMPSAPKRELESPLPNPCKRKR